MLNLEKTESASETKSARLRVGIAGLGVASTQVLPAFHDQAPYDLVAGADVRPEARQAFERTYNRPAVASVEELAKRADIDAIWISTPNTVHAEHSVCAARHGKHIICEKPIAVTLAECDQMIAAAAANGVQFLQGHSKIYQAPIKAIRDVVKSGKLGRVVQIHAANFNDWLQRPRLAPELDTRQGGGIVYRQGPHLVDIVRFIGGGMVKSVRGTAGKADPNFDAYGHFNALLEFEDGAAASMTFSGYGYFDVTELTWDIGESGFPQTGGRKFPGKPRITKPADAEQKESGAKEREVGKPRDKSEKRQPFFGLTIVFCEYGVIRQSPDGLFVYTEKGRTEVPCSASGGREAELRELSDALATGRTVFPDGRWGKATLEVCLAIMESSRSGAVQAMKYQTPSP